MNTICLQGSVEGNFTNHSLRATGTTLLFFAGVPKTVIQKWTGNKSVVALQTYERLTPSQELAVSNILAGETPGAQSYNQAKEKEYAGTSAEWCRQ